MEDNTVRRTELEEIESDVEVAEGYEDSRTGAFVAGIVGGFLAYAVIGGTKKLVTFIGTKLEARKAKKANGGVIDAEIVEIDGEQIDSDEEAPSR